MTGTRGYLYVLITISCMVYSQLMLKWQMRSVGLLPGPPLEKLRVLLSMFLNGGVLSSYAAVFVAALCWMAAMTKFELSHAYPFMGLTFAFVLFFSGIFLHEPITMPKVVGVVLIIAGITIGSQG